MRQNVMLASFVSIAVGTAVVGSVLNLPYAAATTVSAVHAAPLQAAQDKPAPPADSAPLTRDEIIKQGPAALEQNCTKCHGSDKWEGTSRDHDGWAAIVATMTEQMAQAQMPPMNDRTTRLIVDYLTLTHPQ